MGSVSRSLSCLKQFFNCFRRWCLYDTITDLLFGKRLGFVRQGADVDGLLATFRNTGWVIGLMALFPYIVNPLFRLPMIGKYFLPRSDDNIGIGKVMKVVYWILLRHGMIDCLVAQRQSLPRIPVKGVHLTQVVCYTFTISAQH